MTTINGTSGGDTLNGASGDDTLIGNGGQDVLDGWAGDDYVESLGASGLTDINGQRGNDTLVGSVPGSGQIHMRGGAGDDLLRMDVTNSSGHQGHHAYGGIGADVFEFVNTSEALSPILGRIDDFDYWQDEIWVEGTPIDLYNLPPGIDIVAYLGQQWLRIGENILYALEGARDAGAEQHFSALPSDISALTPVDYVDQQNFVPLPEYEANLASLTLLESQDLTITGTSGNDLIEGWRNESHIFGGEGDDVINGSKGNDSIVGGLGHDKLAGGVDNDTLEGGMGDDMLWGGSEDDFLDGGDGADYLEGGTGNDLLYGDGGFGQELPIWLIDPGIDLG